MKGVKFFVEWVHGKVGKTLRDFMEKEKTISQQFEEITREMCEEYCKWPLLWDEESEGVAL